MFLAKVVVQHCSILKNICNQHCEQSRVTPSSSLPLVPLQAESPFGVSEAHSGVILDFLHFARSRRGRCLKSVEVEFQVRSCHGDW